MGSVDNRHLTLATFDHRHVKFDTMHWTCDGWELAAGIWHFIFDIWYGTSDIWDVVFDIRWLTPNVWHLTITALHLPYEIMHLTDIWHFHLDRCTLTMTFDAWRYWDLTFHLSLVWLLQMPLQTLTSSAAEETCSQLGVPKIFLSLQSWVKHADNAQGTCIRGFWPKASPRILQGTYHSMPDGAWDSYQLLRHPVRTPIHHNVVQYFIGNEKHKNIWPTKALWQILHLWLFGWPILWMRLRDIRVRGPILPHAFHVLVETSFPRVKPTISLIHSHGMILIKLTDRTQTFLWATCRRETRNMNSGAHMARALGHGLTWPWKFNTYPPCSL